CPWLLANPKWGPGWAFGIPGIAMVIATLFFWGGRKKMVHVPPAGLGYLRETFSREGLLTLARIAMVYVFILVFWALWGMSNGVEWTLQAEKMNLHWLGMNLIAAQVQTANPILILLFIPLVNYVIYPAVEDRKSTRLNSSHDQIFTLSLHDALPISGSPWFTCLSWSSGHSGE